MGKTYRRPAKKFDDDFEMGNRPAGIRKQRKQARQARQNRRHDDAFDDLEEDEIE